MRFVWFCVFVSAFIGCFVTEQQILGDPQDVPVTDAEVVASAQFAVAEFNKANPRMKYELVAITLAKVQSIAVFVPAWNYILELRLRRTTCNPGTKKLCNSKPKELQCHFTVYYTLEHPCVLTESECKEPGKH
ncbi:cystatin-C-like [Etheostoma spectabile]|uniref:cystatin-C-like n=1 Tax=Etheostoma spectabile TaxID=54343 RepID=UPI0013AE995F|nr:cystatin-C-like [Etheostoma spectabile]